MRARTTIGAWFFRHASAVATIVALILLMQTLLAVAALLSLHAPLADLVMAPAVVAFIVSGWLLAVRLPRNAVGWLLLVTSFGLGLLVWPAVAAWMITHSVPGGRWIGAFGESLFVFIVGGLALLLPLTFPDGRLPSSRRRWRMVLWSDIGYVLFASFNVFDRAPLDLPTLRGKIPNPLATATLTHLTALIVLCVPMLFVGFIGSLTSMFVRWRRAGSEQRQQLKWVFVALALSLVPFILNDTAPAASNVAFTFILPLVPIAVALSVLRYRLYDIDRIVSRAVSYLLVTGLLVGVYIGCVALAEAVLPVGSSSLTVAASTLAVAALFQPVRRRVQAAVDHRFNRQRYDAARTIDAFAGRLRDEVDPDVVRHDLLDVTARAIQPSSISLWVAS
jgi:hypothetical protein